MYQGAIVNTTTIYDQTSPRNQIQYNVSQFVNSNLPGGGVVPDGEYRRISGDTHNRPIISG